jgi:diacylglycerol kinase family enzyme
MPMGRRRAKIIVTPGSGEGRAAATAARLKALLRRRGWEASVQTFRDLQSLEQWARDTRADFSHLVCVGGDTTLSKAALLPIRTGVPVVPVPNGFGNVFAGVFGHSSRTRDVARLLEQGEVRRVDVGRCGDDVFVSHRSYGFLDQIQQDAERGRRQPRSRLLRHLWYYGVSRRFFVGPLASIRVEVDGVLVAEGARVVTVANVETYRGFLCLTPAASPVDEMFDVFVVPNVTRYGLAWRLAKLLLRLPRRWRGVSLHRGRCVVVTIDGRRDEITSVRRALPLLVAPGTLDELRRRAGEVEREIAAAS